MDRVWRYKMNNFSIQIPMVPPVSETIKLSKTPLGFGFGGFFGWLVVFFWGGLGFLGFFLDWSVKLKRIISAQELLHLGLISLHQPQQRQQFHAIIIHHNMQAQAACPGAEQQTHHALFSKMFTANVKF